MKTDEEARLDTERIRKTYRQALWDPTPPPKEMPPLLAELEGYIGQLGPKVVAAATQMPQDMQGTAAVVLGHVDEVLADNAPRADQAARLHDLGVVTRALVALLELPPEPTPDPAPEPGGWLLVVPPHDAQS